MCIFMQFCKKLAFSMVSAIYKFGITYILPNNSSLSRCFRSAKLVVYAVHAQCMQRYVAMAIRCLGSWAIRHGARWYMGVVSFGVSGCTPPPLPPRGAGKTGRLSGDGPCATTHSLLRLPAKHRPARCSTQVRRKFVASARTAFFTSFQRHSIHYLGDLHLVFTTFDAIL